MAHKMLRWLLPFFILGLFLSNLYLLNSSSMYFKTTLFLQVGLYSLGLLGHILIRKGSKYPVFYIPYYFILVNTAAFIGIVEAIKGQKIIIWNPERELKSHAKAIYSNQKSKIKIYFSLTLSILLLLIVTSFYVDKIA